MSVRYTPGGRFVETFVIVENVRTVPIQKFPARVAYGARKPRTMCLGGAETTANIIKRNDRKALLAYAYNSHAHKMR